MFGSYVSFDFIFCGLIYQDLNYLGLSDSGPVDISFPNLSLPDLRILGLGLSSSF